MNPKWDFSKEVMNLVTMECLVELWSLFEFNLSKQKTEEELDNLNNSDLFKTCMTNSDYHLKIWWERFLYAGIRINVRKLGNYDMNMFYS